MGNIRTELLGYPMKLCAGVTILSEYHPEVAFTAAKCPACLARNRFDATMRRLWALLPAGPARDAVKEEIDRPWAAVFGETPPR